MNNLIGAPSTSNPQSCDGTASRELTGSVVARSSLTVADRDRMYALLSGYFVRTCRGQFEEDLAEKESVVLLRDRHTSQIQGFSTLMQIEACVNGREIVAFFSGDTIVAAEYWGDSLLSRLWSQMVFERSDGIRARRPTATVFWFLICSGYKTFRFLPVFFRTFYPNPHVPTPPEMQELLDALGEAKFGQSYDSASGIVRLEEAALLRGGVADITEQRLRDPMVSFFASRNPGYLLGDELACITEITRSNLTRAGQRMVGSASTPA